MVGSHISLSPGCHHITNDQPMHYSREIPPIHHIFAFFDKSIYNDPYKITGAKKESNPFLWWKTKIHGFEVGIQEPSHRDTGTPPGPRYQARFKIRHSQVWLHPKKSGNMAETGGYEKLFQEVVWNNHYPSILYLYKRMCYIYIYICINRYTPVSTYMCIKRWMQGLNPKKAPKSCTLFHSLRVSNLRPNLLENLQAPRYGNAGPFPDDTNSGQKRRFLGWLEH